uniref:Zinc finger protein 655 n=1 Tax=Piliocolobus tephrosceles TaxID=591936 RepID=A0A8C9LHS5_9PRIM
MEKIPAQEAAGSPRVQFQFLETQFKSLTPEPHFVQATDMEQGLTRAPPVPQVPALPHEESPGDQAAVLLTVRYQCLFLDSVWRLRFSASEWSSCSLQPFMRSKALLFRFMNSSFFS